MNAPGYEYKPATMEPLRIREAILAGKKAYVLGSQLILPFRCHVYKITLEHETFHRLDQEFVFRNTPRNTVIFFRRGSWRDHVSPNHPHAIFLAADWDVDLTNPQNHILFLVKIYPGREAPLSFPPEDFVYVL